MHARLTSATALAAWSLLALAPLGSDLSAQDASAAARKSGLGRMWTFENPPLAYLKDEYGFTPDQTWFDAMRMGALRYGSGCSASFVSPKGLIMTNHHCARGNLAAVSPKDQDWGKDGFYASSLEGEVKVPGLTVQQLHRIVDITQRMQTGIRSTDDDKQRAKKLAANEAEIMAEAKQLHPGKKPEIVKLNQGAVYQLYIYRIYDDIRLVCAPELTAAYFGGDPDNFTYPRYCLDYTFLRAWENGKPADTRNHYFRWSKQGAKPKELTFVVGNPGSTGRLLTKAQMEFLRDVNYPIIRELIDNRLAIMRKLASQSPEMEKQLRTTIFSYANSEKAYRGYHGGLLDEKLMARKAEIENELRERVNANADLKARFGDAWDQLADISKQKAELDPKSRFHSPGGSPHLARALTVVRAVTSEGEQKAKLTKQAMESTPKLDARGRAFFVDHLTRAMKWLKPDDPYRRDVLKGRSPEDAAVMFEAESQIGDTAFVQSLLDAGKDEVMASKDPAIAAARALLPLLRQNQQKNTELTARESAQGTRIGQALFEVYGNKVSPDATFTLRFSDGKVDGFPYNGTKAPWRTSFYGLYGRAASFDNKEPFNLSPKFVDAKSKLDLSTAMNFVSTNDIIGGNSGSPILNKDLEVIGVIFDGNIEMLPNRFLYSDEVSRTVSVHSEAILESLDKVYEARRVVDELRGTQGGGGADAMPAESKNDVLEATGKTGTNR